MIRPNDYFDQIYLINLPRRPDKLTKSLHQLDRFGIRAQVVEAVDGYHPEHYFQQDRLPKGAFGYLLSWIKVIEDAIANYYRRILIFDDDLILIKNFNQKFSQSITWLKKERPNWLIYHLGATQHTKRPDLVNGRSPNFYHPLVTDGSFAVGLNGLEQLKDRSFDSLFSFLLEELNTKDQLVDSDILRKVYRLARPQCFVSYPNLVISDVTSSDIRVSRDQLALSQKLGWSPLSQYHYPPAKPLVSLIISAYNAERTIVRSLESVIRQTYRPLQVVITDDGSSDQTYQLILETVRKWEYSPAGKDLIISVDRFEQNRGSYHARNHGLARARGELITFHDADDVSLDNRIETQVNLQLEKGVALTCCLILRTHLESLPRDPVKLLRGIKQTSVHPGSYCCRAKVGLVTTMFRRSMIEKLGQYPTARKWGMDATYLYGLFPELDRSYRMMNYLDQTKEIKGKYYRVDQILYLSPQMTHQNLTYQRLKQEKRKV